MTVWTDHVKAFAKEHNVSYPCAISMPACMDSYKGIIRGPKRRKPKVAQPKPKVYSAEDETAIREMIDDARQALEEAEADAETDPVGFRAFKKKMEQVIEEGLKSLANPYSPKPKKVYLLKAPKVKKPKPKPKVKAKPKPPEMYRLTNRELALSDIMQPEIEQEIKENAQFSKQVYTEAQIKEAKRVMDLFTDFHLKVTDTSQKKLLEALKGFMSVALLYDEGRVSIMVWYMVLKYWNKLGLYTPKRDTFGDIYPVFPAKLPTKKETKAWTGSDPEGEKKEKEKEKKKQQKERDKQAKKDMLAEEKQIKEEAKLREKEDKMPVYTGREKELRDMPSHQLEDMVMSYKIKSGTSKDAMVAAILMHESKPKAKPVPRGKPVPKAETKFTPLEEAFPTEIIQKKITIQKPIQKPATAAEIKAFREKTMKDQKIYEAKSKQYAAEVIKKFKEEQKAKEKVAKSKGIRMKSKPKKYTFSVITDYGPPDFTFSRYFDYDTEETKDGFKFTFKNKADYDTALDMTDFTSDYKNPKKYKWIL